MNDNINKIRELEEQLTPFPESITDVEGFKSHQMTSGESLSWNTLRQFGLDEEVSSALWFNSKGTNFPKHTHQQKEWLIVVKGSMFLTVNQQEIPLVYGQGIEIRPNTPHSARFTENCWYLAITVPSNPDWPK